MIEFDFGRWVWWADIGKFKCKAYILTTNWFWVNVGTSKAFRLALDFRVCELGICFDISLGFIHLSLGITFFNMDM